MRFLRCVFPSFAPTCYDNLRVSILPSPPLSILLSSRRHPSRLLDLLRPDSPYQTTRLHPSFSCANVYSGASYHPDALPSLPLSILRSVSPPSFTASRPPSSHLAMRSHASPSFSESCANVYSGAYHPPRRHTSLLNQT